MQGVLSGCGVISLTEISRKWSFSGYTYESETQVTAREQRISVLDFDFRH